MTNYYISDTHFGHKNIVRLDADNGCRNFDSIEEHDNLIIENWNKTVTPRDNVYILGDFSWLDPRYTEDLIRRLNGAKFLVRGNHDRWSKNSVCKKLFQGMYDYNRIHDGDHVVVMSHYPMLFYQGQHSDSIHLYGHVHNTREEYLFQEACKNIADRTDIPMRCYNVGCMHWNYTPVTLNQILEKNHGDNNRRYTEV